MAHDGCLLECKSVHDAMASFLEKCRRNPNAALADLWVLSLCAMDWWEVFFVSRIARCMHGG